MTSSSISAPRRRSRAPGVVMATVLLVLGALVDVCALVNVPGAAVFPAVQEGTPRITGLGTALFLLVVVAWASTIWRRRSPIWALIAGAVLALVGVSYLLLLVGAVAFVRRYPEKIRITAILVASGVGVFALREGLTPWGGALAWFFGRELETTPALGWGIASVVCALGCLGIAAGVVIVARARQRAEQSDQRAAAEHRRADALSEQAVRQAERERIAREVHDALAHRLSVVSLHAGALEVAAGGESASEIARTVREQTHAALQDMRGLVGDLRDGRDAAAVAPSNIGALGAMVAELRAQHPITSFVVVEAPERMATMLGSAVYRITQEALTNAIKHAPGAAIDLFVQAGPAEGARVRVVNPLTPPRLDAVPGGRNGLIGIRERAASLGGDAWIGPHEGAFIVDVSLPWQEQG